MKRAAWLVLLLVAVAVVFGYAADLVEEDVRVAAAPPLSLEGYLDEKLPEAPKKEDVVKVDNQFCYVCHGNYEGEELVLAHAKEAVGCVDCHDESFPHRNDEDNITPPDKMYVPGDVDEMCGKCHKKHNAPAMHVIARWQQRCPTKTDPKTIVCTDCHGGHRLKLRTVWWDKKTGKLIIRKKGERIKVAPDPKKKKPGQPADEPPAPETKMR